MFKIGDRVSTRRGTGVITEVRPTHNKWGTAYIDCRDRGCIVQLDADFAGVDNLHKTDNSTWFPMDSITAEQETNKTIASE